MERRPSGTNAAPRTRQTDGVQSLARGFELLEVMADNGGIIGLSDLSKLSGMSLPTIHRLMRTMVDLGYARQAPSRKYALGPRLARLGASATGVLGVWAQPELRRLVDDLSETANLAVLDGHDVLYLANEPGRHSMRMITDIGRRAAVHCTAVGKAILAELPEHEFDAMFENADMPAYTENSITNPVTLKREVQAIRRRGYATDEEEQEIGVRCVAVALPATTVRGAISISGPVGRMTEEVVEHAVPQLRAAAQRLVGDFAE